ncbi:chemosensory protein 3 [Bombus fervidus]|uniref:chemosensory protein 3 n=1 Tax=Bombus fervidus TaxID=203811 RepID=UPI003AB3502B
MKAMHQILTCLFLVMAIVYTVARPDNLTPNLFPNNIISMEKYPEKFDHINVDEIMKNERLFDSYYKCAVDDTKCTIERRNIRDFLSEALATECLKCTEKQKEIINKLVHFLITKRQKVWDHVMSKHDPENTYKYKYEERVNLAHAGAN